MITPREYFAAHSIQAVYGDLAKSNELDFETVARLAFALADMMLLQSAASGEKSETFRFCGFANLFSDGELGIVVKHREDLPGSDEKPEVVRVYIEQDRTAG